MPALYDMHFHLDFALDPTQIAADAQEIGAKMLACTVVPKTYDDLSLLSERYRNICAGIGLHPWWIPEEKAEQDELLYEICSRIDSVNKCSGFLVGEVGIDLSKRAKACKQDQIRIFEQICVQTVQRAKTLEKPYGAIISIHAINSAQQVLDILETTEAVDECLCIMHWFSGSSDQLARAKKLGCYFSVNPMMGKSKRGKEYIKAIPEKLLLLETDGPVQSSNYTAADQQKDLSEALRVICEIKGEGAKEKIAANSKKVISLYFG